MINPMCGGPRTRNLTTTDLIPDLDGPFRNSVFPRQPALKKISQGNSGVPRTSLLGWVRIIDIYIHVDWLFVADVFGLLTQNLIIS